MHRRKAARCVAPLSLALASLFIVSSAGADEAPADSIESLRAELARTRAEYDERLRRLEERLSAAEAAAPAEPPAPPMPDAAPASRKGLSNPDIGVVGDFHAQWDESGGGEIRRNLDFEMSEVEVSFASVVDPWLRFDVFATFHGPEDEEALYPSGAPKDDVDDEGGLAAEIEEAYVTTLGAPGGLQLRGGRFRNRLGPFSARHPHDQPWCDEPTVLEAFLGEDLVDDGVELSWLTPAPFYWELVGSATRGPSESPTFGRADDDDFLYTGHSKLFFALGPEWSLELGGSGAVGPGEADASRTSRVLGADVALKWRPSSHRGFTAIVEWLQRDMPILLEPPGDDPRVVRVHDRGAYAHVEGRLTKRQFLGLRVDWLDYDDDFFADPRTDDRRDASLVWQFWPSEFQGLKVQAKRTWDDLSGDPHDAFLFEWVWITGAHGAHAF